MIISGTENYINYAGAALKTKAEDNKLSFMDTLAASINGDARIRSKEIPVAEKQVPYSNLAQNGIINYNGVVFVCDYEQNAICLGDMSNPDDVLSIPLSGGGTLRVNRDNIDSLSKAIGMFSPEDVNRILRAIAEDAHRQRKLLEIEDEENKIGQTLKSDDEASKEFV